MTGILRSLGIERWGWHMAHKDHPDRRWLDLTKLAPTPTPCATFTEMLATYPDHVVPMALLALDGKTKKRWVAEGVDPSEYLRSTHPFHRLQPSYIAAPFRVLVEQLFPRLSLRDRNLAAIVLPRGPVHYYADLDGGAEWCLEQESECRTEFVQLFSAFFQQVYARAPDLSGMHWEIASRPGKFSIHVHLTSEAFASFADLKEFDRRFHLYLLTACDLATSRLCRGPGEKLCLLDSSVYNVHSVIRVFGNCKPRGGMLKFWPMSDADVQPSDAELIWRGLPNHSLPAAPYVYLACAVEVTAKKVGSGMPRKRTAEVAQLDDTRLQKLLTLLQTNLGPRVTAVRMKDWDTLDGYCPAGTAWCVRKHTLNGEEHYHASNCTFFRLNHSRSRLVIRCLHPDCKSSPREVNAMYI